MNHHHHQHSSLLSLSLTHSWQGLLHYRRMTLSYSISPYLSRMATDVVTNLVQLMPLLGLQIFPKIYSNLSKNFWKFVKNFFTLYVLIIIIIMFPSPALQSDIVTKHVPDKQLSRSSCFNFMHCVKKS